MTAPPTSSRRDARVIGLVGTGHFFSHFYMLVLPPLFPLIKAEYDISYTALGAVIAAFAVASGSAQLPVGFLVDRIGARGPLIAGLVLLGGAIALMGLTTSYPALVLLALAAGLGNSVFHPADYAILSAGITPSRLGRAYSIHTFSGMAGWACAPPLMVFLTTLWDWRTALVIVGCLGLAVALVLLIQSRHLADHRTAPVEPAAAPARGTLGLLLSAPILLLFMFFVMIAMTSGGFQAFSVTALVQLHDLELTTANAALTVYLVAGALGVLLGGPLADRTERYDAVAVVGFLAAAGLMAVVAAVALPFALLIVAFGLAGLMQGIIWPSRDMLVRSITPPGASGKVFGFVSTGLDVGGALAPLMFGLIVDGGLPAWVFWFTALFLLLSMAFAVAAAQVARRGSVAVAAE
jgi:MFS family permease